MVNLKRKSKSILSMLLALAMAVSLLAGTAFAASEGDMSGATSSSGASSDAAIYISGNEVTESEDGTYSYTSIETTDDGVVIDGLVMESGDYTYSGVSVTGSSTVELNNATITLNVDELIEGTETAGTAVAVDSGILYISDSTITVNGAGRYTVANYNSAVLVINGSSIIAGGDLGADGNTSTVSDPASNAALLVSGTSRSNFSIGASVTYYYNSECIAEGWAALSTDSASGNGLELIAYNTYAEATNGGYGTYADTSCRDYLYGVTFNSAELGAIISNNGEIYIGSGADAEGATTENGNEVLAYLDGDTTDAGSVIYGARNAVQMHSPDMMGSGTAGYQAVLTVENSTLTTVADEEAGLTATSTYDYYEYGDAVGAYVDYIMGSVLLVKSTGAVITLNNVEMESSNGILIHTIINSDSMSRFITAGNEGYDVEVYMTDMDVEGDIVHDDYQRDLIVTLSNTTITGAVTTATADSWYEQWEEYADDESAYWTTINNDTYNTDTHDTDITLEDGSVWYVDDDSNITTLDIDDTSYVVVADGVTLTIESGTYAGTYTGTTISTAEVETLSGEIVISEDVIYAGGVTFADDAVVSAAEDGYTVVMTVNGVQYDIEAGETYTGYVVLEYTKYVIDTYGSHGSETEQYMTVALSIKTDEDGNAYIDYEESVESALVGVTFEYDEDGNLIGASGATITSYGDYFGGVRVGEEAEFTVDDFDITLYGNGGNDFTGIGAAFAVCDTAVLTVNDSSIYTEGALRSACFAGDESALYVNSTSIETHSLWDEYGVSLQEVSIDTAGMTTPPTGLGVYGNNRANNVVDYASAYYTDCTIYADSWGAMGCDDVESAEDEEQYQYFTDCTIYVANAGYGAYSIGYIWDMVDSTDITVENGLGIVVAAEGSAKIYNGSTITSGRIGIVTHQGMGAVSNIVVTGTGTSVTAEYTAILVKERASAITISDGATLTSDSGAIIQAVENDDSGAGSLQGTETVDIDIEDTVLTGDILQSLAGAPMTVTITDATVTGAISTATETYSNGGTVSTYEDVGIIVNNVLEATDDDLYVVLSEDGYWVVTETSYLDALEVAATAVLDGIVTVDGEVVDVTGGADLEGDIVVYPSESDADSDDAGSDDAGSDDAASASVLTIISAECYNDVTSTGAQSTVYSVTYDLDGTQYTVTADTDEVLTLVVDSAQEDITAGAVYTVEDSFEFVSTTVVDSGGPSSPPWEGLSDDEGSVYYFRQALLVEDGEIVADASVTQIIVGGTYDSSSMSGATITINGSHFNGIYITGTSTYAISDVEVYATGDGGDDFSGWGAAIMADGSTTVTIDSSYIETAGTIRTAIWVGGSSVTTVTNSVIYAQETEDDYVTYQNLLPAMMKRVPFALGMEGTVRATNVLGSGQGIYSNSIIVSTGWGALSTDSGTSYSQTGTYALDVSDSLAGIGTLYSNDGEGYATEAEAIAAAGDTENLVVTKEINGVWYALEVTGSGYVTYADAGVMNYYTNVEFYSPDYVQILASGLSSSTYEDSYMYSERIAFMTQQAGGGTLTLIDSTVDTTDALLQIKSGAANTGYTDFVINNTTVNFSGDSVRTEAGILVELIESDDAGNPGVTTYTVSDTGADAEVTSSTITDSNATFQNGDYTGDIWNSIYNYYQALNVTLEEGANLTGTVSSSVHVHIDPSTGEIVENGTVLNAYTGSEEGDIADYRDSEYGTTGDYLIVGSVLHTANEVINNPINLTIDATSTWTVTGLGYLNSLTVESLDSISAADSEGVTIYTAALTVAGEAYADGTYEANGVTIVVAASDAEAEESSYIEGGQTYASIAYGFYAETADGAAASSKVTLETLNYIDGNVYFNVEAVEGYEITDIVVTGGTVEANSGTYEELSSYKYMLVPDGSGDEMTVTFILSAIGSEEEEEEPDEETGEEEEEEDEYGYTLTADDIEVAVGETAQIEPVLAYGIIAPSVSSNYISESVVLTEDVTYADGLTIAEGVEISADADGYTIVMTVDGVQMDIEDGTTYEGCVVLEYTKYVIDYYESHGSETEQYMTVALSIKTDDDGNQYIDYEESVESALVDCEYDEYGLTGGSITSYGEYFGGVRVSGDAEYTVDGIDITLYGNGGNDFTGIGAAIAICDNAVATVDNSSIYTEGALRSACFAGDYSTLYVNTTSIETHSLWDEYGVSLQEVSIDTAGMTTPPTGLGVYGNNRANNVVDYASAYYTDCDIYADSWGAMGCDDVESAEDEDQFQYFTNCTIYVANSGYGAYSIGYIWDMVDGSDITVENGLGLVAAAEGSVMVYNGSTITSGRIGIVTHQGMGAVSNIVVTEDSSVTAEYTAILVKERASAITISDGATLTSNSGAIIQAVENDDSGAGSLQGDETVTVDIEDTALTGDILQSLADVPMTVTITDATVTGAISTATETYENGGTVETYANVGIISENVLEATGDELIVILEENALWVVTETSYLDSLEVAATAEIDGVVYVDGVEVDVTNGGTYTGEIVVEPAEDSTDSVPEDLDSDMGVDSGDTDDTTSDDSDNPAANDEDFDFTNIPEDGMGPGSSGNTGDDTVTEEAAGATTSVWDAYIEYLVEYVENNTFNGDSTTEEMVELVQALTEDSYESEIIYEVLTSFDGDAMTYETFAETYVAEEEEEEDASDNTAGDVTEGELSGEGTSLTYATAEDADGNTVITLSNSNAFEVYTYTITLGEGLALVDGDLEGSVSSSDVTITVSGEGTAALEFTGTYGDTEAYSETITIGAAADDEETPDDTEVPDDAETPDEGTGTDEDSEGEVTYTYASADETIATVDADGLVTGVAAGETTIDITAYVDGEEVAETTINVTVTDETVEEPAEPETEGGDEDTGDAETPEEGGDEDTGDAETPEEGGDEDTGDSGSTGGTDDSGSTGGTDDSGSTGGTDDSGSTGGTDDSGSTGDTGTEGEGSGSEITGGEEETEAETEAEAEETESTSAATGDATNVALWMALAALAVLGLAFLSLKKKFN